MIIFIYFSKKLLCLLGGKWIGETRVNMERQEDCCNRTMWKWYQLHGHAGDKQWS